MQGKKKPSEYIVKELKKMYEYYLKKQLERFYKNSGQHAEQLVKYNLLGTIEKADNTPYYKAGDCGSLQIKSARATICKGTDLLKHLEKDKATEYGYVTADFSIMYVMNRKEYIEFVATFGTITRDSQKNGGAEKIRLKSESKAMREWLENNL